MKATLAIIVALELLVQTTGLQLRPISVRKNSPLSLGHPTESDASHTRVTNRHGLHQLNMRNRCDEYADFILKPRWGGPVLGEIVRYFNTLFIGTVSVFILRVMNRFRVFRREILINRIFNREKGRGLLTVSNHQSVFDDPGVLSAFIPLWRFFFRSNRLRWVLCTEDVFFANKWVQKILAAGNVIPLDRSGSLEQPLFQRFQEKLAEGNWCHIFAEGKVRQEWRFEDDEPRLGEFKYGVGKLIAHCEKTPIVIPFYHKGMDKVIPEKVLEKKKTKRASTPKSLVPRGGNDITVYIGEPIDFTEKMKAFRERHPGALDSWRSTMESIHLYEEITLAIRAEVLKLEAEAWGRQQS